ncbi:hypothetical protein DRQ32_04660 [bacterium]|nr:MAG: hypothetical protein DRQ32_04660 [bacterium]
MRARIGLLVLLILPLGCSPLSPVDARAQDSPMAVLMARQGEVTIMRGTDALAGNFGMHLGLGDEIRTGSDSSADILFATGQALQLGANGSLVVQGAGGGNDGMDTPNVFAQAEQLLIVGAGGGKSLIGGVRSAGNTDEIIAVSPRRAARGQERPVFRWSGGSGDLQITIEHAGDVHWQGKVSDATELKYPADAPSFVGGETYSWRVKTDDPLALVAAESQTAFFTTLDREEEAALAATLVEVRSAQLAESTIAVMMAGVLFDHGLVDEAIAVLDVAIAGGGEVEGLTAVRGNLRGANWP